MYKIKTLQTMGSNHNLHSEDELLTWENDQWLVCAVFDGCSSGQDSHIASYMHKKYLQEYLDLDVIKEEKTSQLVILYAEAIIRYIWRKLLLHDIYDNQEMLSTIVLLIINKDTEEYEIAFCGDGFAYVNGEVVNVHEKDGNTVWYLSTVEDFDEYWNTYCKKISGKGVENICISTDGIDSFQNKYGQTTDQREYFCNNKQFDAVDNQLKRLYKILTTGLYVSDEEKAKNYDDFTMIKIEKKR